MNEEWALEGDYAPIDEPENETEESSETLQSYDIVVEKGQWIAGKFYPPTINYESYLMVRYDEARRSEFLTYEPFTHDRFLFEETAETINYFPKDMRFVLGQLLKIYPDTLQVVQGLTGDGLCGVSVHSVGIAIDVSVKNKEEATKLAYAAYRIGFANVYFLGDFSKGQGCVHLDLAPKKEKHYGQGIFNP